MISSESLASTNNTNSTTSINAQTQADNDNKPTTSIVVTPSSQCQPRRHNSNKHNNNDFNPIASPPPTFVDETQIDETEVSLTAPSPPPIRVIRPTLSGPSITSALSTDTVLDDDGDPLLYHAVSFSPAHGNHYSDATVGGCLLIEAKDLYARARSDFPIDSR